MEIQKTKLEGVLLVKPDISEDHRGTYTETFNKKLYAEHGISVEFVCDDLSTSSKGVLRGIHGDAKTYKLVSCGYGRLYLAVVNCDETSPQYKQWDSFVLTDANRWQVLVPPKFGNGHLALSEKIMFCYKQSEYYDPASQFSIRFDDPKYNVWWPIKNPVLSQRDEGGKQ
jgi:dTDP-4-dehydrorhamnose 3,5-epimerase